VRRELPQAERRPKHKPPKVQGRVTRPSQPPPASKASALASLASGRNGQAASGCFFGALPLTRERSGILLFSFAATQAQQKLLGCLLWNQCVEPESTFTDGLKSFVAALHELELKESSLRRQPPRDQSRQKFTPSNSPVTEKTHVQVPELGEPISHHTRRFTTRSICGCLIDRPTLRSFQSISGLHLGEGGRLGGMPQRVRDSGGANLFVITPPIDDSAAIQLSRIVWNAARSIGLKR